MRKINQGTKSHKNDNGHPNSSTFPAAIDCSLRTFDPEFDPKFDPGDLCDIWIRFVETNNKLTMISPFYVVPEFIVRLDKTNPNIAKVTKVMC